MITTSKRTRFSVILRMPSSGLLCEDAASPPSQGTAAAVAAGFKQQVRLLVAPSF
jgi:hypothetical protein